MSPARKASGAPAVVTKKAVATKAVTKKAVTKKAGTKAAAGTKAVAPKRKKAAAAPLRAQDVLPELRQICLSLPETNERLSHGSPAFFVRDKKTFVMFVDDHHGDGILGIWCAAAPGVQGQLVDEEPERFFVPPYVGHRGWLGVRFDRDLDWDEVDEIVTDAYRQVAPKQLLAQLDDA